LFCVSKSYTPLFKIWKKEFIRMRTFQVNMKKPSKGERLKWTPLKDLKPTKLTKELTKGNKVVLTPQKHSPAQLVP
jgi:hypothetical protein